MAIKVSILDKNQCYVNRGYINPVPDSVSTYSSKNQLQGTNISRANTQLSERCNVSQVFIPEVLSYDFVYTETAKCIDQVLPSYDSDLRCCNGF